MCNWDGFGSNLYGSFVGCAVRTKAVKPAKTVRTAHPMGWQGFCSEISDTRKRQTPRDSSLRWNDSFKGTARIEAASCLKLHEQY